MGGIVCEITTVLHQITLTIGTIKSSGNLKATSFTIQSEKWETTACSTFFYLRQIFHILSQGNYENAFIIAGGNDKKPS